jgi:hypothetical protein
MCFDKPSTGEVGERVRTTPTPQLDGRLLDGCSRRAWCKCFWCGYAPTLGGSEAVDFASSSFQTGDAHRATPI